MPDRDAPALGYNAPIVDDSPGFRIGTLDREHVVVQRRRRDFSRAIGRSCSWLVAIALLGACGKETVPKSSGWSDFQGIQYRAPAGTNVTSADGVLPGPEGLGGIPRGARISVTLTKPKGFYVEIVKNAEPTSLEGEKHVLLANKVGTNMVGKATSTGWELTYDMPVTNDARLATQAHEVYADLAGGHFTCSYADVNCANPSAAEAICRSIRLKPAE
jgi:hypothetical protein